METGWPPFHKPMPAETLLAAQAGEEDSYLLTGDKDFLALADRYPIVTPAVFWAVYGSLGG